MDVSAGLVLAGALAIGVHVVVEWARCVGVGVDRGALLATATAATAATATAAAATAAATAAAAAAAAATAHRRPPLPAVVGAPGA